MLSLSDQLSQIRHKDCFEIFKGIINAVLSFYNTYNVGHLQFKQGNFSSTLLSVMNIAAGLLSGRSLAAFCYMPLLPSPFIGSC